MSGIYEPIADLPQPTISALAGHCLGGPWSLVTHFRVIEFNIGIRIAGTERFG